MSMAMKAVNRNFCKDGSRKHSDVRSLKESGITCMNITANLQKWVDLAPLFSSLLFLIALKQSCATSSFSMFFQCCLTQPYYRIRALRLKSSAA
ncbi:hypothetical protein VNO80_20890 [Phaseolus coccineus]|uniref:Uncharacterized protein n=1 Tax=Phaseolus coccineus TaxID=3886 RepID=A0AAN9M6W6_PHACN